MPSVQFQFRDLAKSLLSSDVTPRVKVTPAYAPLNFSSSIISKDPLEANLDENSSATIEDIVPNLYHCELWTNKVETTFDMLVTNSASGSLSAADCMVSTFTGSFGGTTYFKLVPAPASLDDPGQEGWLAMDATFIYVYSGGWKRSPISQF